MKEIVKHFDKKSWLYVLLNAVVILLQVFAELKMPDYMAEITQLVQTQGSQLSGVLIAGAKMLLCALVTLIMAILIHIISAKIAADYSFRVRAKLYTKVSSFSLEQMNKFSSASLITRSTNDITQVQNIIAFGTLALIKAPVMSVWAISKIWGKHYQWTITTVISVLIVCAVLLICYFFALPKFQRIQGLTDNINRITRENLTGLRVIKAYNAEKYQEEKFDVSNQILSSTHLFTGRVMAFLMPSIQLVMSGLTLAIYWLGAAMIDAAELTEKITLFSDMVVFSQYAMQVVMAFMLLVMIFIILPRASVSAKRILEVLDTEPTIIDGKETEGTETGTIEFRNISFRYPDAEEDVLKNISFTAKKGETVAFIGATGCGKSTVINMIPRFYDATEGEVLVNGRNVKEYEQKALRNKIGYVSQKAILFSGTVQSNVAYGNNGKADKLDSDVVDAVYTAQASEFVEKMPDGYNGYIAQNGSNLSGGQKQRLSIARAVCRHPEIMIFDDSFSALDYKTDRKLREALHKECKDATKIVVAQRIGTIRDADRIVVLEDGEIAGMGTHDELMKNCQVYQQIAYSQLSKEELA